MTVIPSSDVISFARGVPAPELFPIAELDASSRQAITHDAKNALNYGDPFGYSPLRTLLARQHHVTPDQIAVTPGSLMGLNFLVRHFFAAGGHSVVEAPTYDRMLHSLAHFPVHIASVDRTDAGLDVNRLRLLAGKRPRPKLLYILPTFHNPTGYTLTLDQRHELVDLALEYELLVLEDDPYGLLRIDGEPLPYVHELLQQRGGDHLAIFATTFSKTVAPGLRVGYLVLPKWLLRAIEALITRTYVSPPLLAQAQLYEFLHSGYLNPHVKVLRSSLRLRRDALLEVLEEKLRGTATWTRPEGGYFVWLELPHAIDANELNARARTIGVEIVPGASFFLAGRGRSSARLAYSFPPVEAIQEGARRLADLILASI